MSSQSVASKDSSSAKVAMKAPLWLVPYNSFSSLLWAIVFFNTILLGWMLGQPHLFEKSNVFVTVVQTLAIVEVYNSLVGNVRSPVFTTAVQVASRFLVVYGIFQVLPQSPANSHWSYTTLCLSWSFTEIIRYSYYSQNITSKGNPTYSLTWLRYNTFFILYPTGVASEIAMIYLSLDEATKVVGTWYSLLLKVVILTYIPGFYMLFTHMIRQRGKALRVAAQKQVKKEQ